MMIPPRASRRPSGATELKLLVAATSLTTALGGWAALSAAQRPADPAPPPPVAEAAPLPPQVPAPWPTIEPLPTLVPLTAFADGPLSTSATAPSQPVPVQVVPSPTPPLRVVAAPRPVAPTTSTAPARPAPVARTRSSR